MSRRKSYGAGERVYNYTRDLLRFKAAKEAAENRYGAALRLCLAELEQMHAHHYPNCEGGCPAHEAINAARKALSR